MIDCIIFVSFEDNCELKIIQTYIMDIEFEIAPAKVFIKHEEDSITTDMQYTENETNFVDNVVKIDIAPTRNVSEDRVFVHVPLVREVRIEENMPKDNPSNRTLRSGSDIQNKIEENNMSKKDREPFKCDYCTKVFKQLFILTKHVHSHHPDKIKPTRCELCNTTFQYKLVLRRHLREVHKGTIKQPITCTVCSKTYIFKEDDEDGCNCAKAKKQEKGTNIKSSKQPKISTIKTKESKKTEKKTKEKKHIVQVNEEKCECILMYPTAKVTDEHIRLFHGDSMGTCFKCNRIFINEEELNKHLPICSSVQGIDPLCMEVTCEDS